MNALETLGYVLLKVGARLWMGRAWKSGSSGYLESGGWRIDLRPKDRP